MEDARIVELYWQRDQQAIRGTERKYGAYCLTTARNILQDARDAEECLNDSYLAALLLAASAFARQYADYLSETMGQEERWRGAGFCGSAYYGGWPSGDGALDALTEELWRQYELLPASEGLYKVKLQPLCVLKKGKIFFNKRKFIGGRQCAVKTSARRAL